MADVTESQGDYESKGDGTRPFCISLSERDGGNPDRLTNEGTNNDVCDILSATDNLISGGRHFGCWHPEYWFNDNKRAYCRPHSADFLEHYVDGSGEDISLDMEQFMEEIPEFEEEVEGAQQAVIDEVIADAEDRELDGPITYPVSTEKVGWGYPEGGVNGGSYV